MGGKNKEKSRIYITKKLISLKYTPQVNITYLLLSPCPQTAG